MDGSGMPLLSLLIWMPIIGGVAVLLAGDQRAGLARWLSLAVSLATLFMSFSLFTGFDRSTSAMQFEEMRPWIDDFSAGYMQRLMHLFPKQGDRDPWRNTQNYLLDKKLIRHAPLEDGALVFSNPTGANVEPLRRSDQRADAA